MEILALVENNSSCDLKPVHGLSLYIKTKNHHILFDLGPDKTLFENAAKRNIDLNIIDTVIISHGHKDHGGALGDFLKINNHAKIYAQRDAFKKHYTSGLGLKLPCMLDKRLATNPQVVLLDGDYKIDDELYLFITKDMSKCYSPMNKALFDQDKKVDDFHHEHNLVIHEEDKNVLIMGCGHAGVVNIMNEAAKFNPAYAIGGFHLCNPVNGKVVSTELLDEIAKELNKYKDTKFYTCHCTGEKAYNYLKTRMNLGYLACGDKIVTE